MACAFAFCSGVRSGLLPAAASADEPSAAVTYSAPADCPDSAAFIALLTTRAAGSWRFREGTGDPQFVVEIREAREGKLGRLRRRTGGRVSDAREVRAGSCQEVVQALALTTTLSLAAAVEEPGASPWRWNVGVGVAAVALLPPAPMLQARIHVETSPLQRNGLHAPDLRLILAHARNDLLSVGAARFSLSSIGVSACPLSWRALRVCLDGDAGVLAGAGRGVDRPRSILTWWTAAGALASARWILGRRVIFESFAGLRVPLRRTDFVFEMPRRPVASIPAACAVGGVSFARTIP